MVMMRTMKKTASLGGPWGRTLGLAVLLSMKALAQDVEVIPITPELGVRARAATEKLKVARKEYEAVYAEASRVYLEVPCILNQTVPNPRAGSRLGPNNKCILEGFPYGADFTRDYKFLVPKKEPYPKNIFDCGKTKP